MAVVALGAGQAVAQVSGTVTYPAGTSLTKVANDQTYSAAVSISLTGNSGAWGGSANAGTTPITYTLTAPPNWEWDNVGTPLPSATGSIFNASTFTIVSSREIRWVLSTNVNPPQTNTISNLRMRPVAGVTAASSAQQFTFTPSGGTQASFGNFNLTLPAVALRFVQNVAATVQNGVAITPAVTVEVIDANNARVTGLPNYTISLAGTGLTLGNATATTASGLATFTGLTVTGLQGAGKTLTATATGLTSANSSAFTLTTGTPNKLGFVVQPGPVAVGGSFSPSVQVAVQDAGGNTVTTATNQIGLAGTGVSLAGTTLLTPVNGVATFSGVTVSGTAGSGKSLRATSSGITLADSSAFVLSPGAAATLSFSQQPSNVQKFLNFNPPVRVAFLDSSGNVATGASGLISLAPTAGQGVSLNGTFQNVAAVNG